MYWLGGYLMLQQGLDHPKISPYHNIKLLSSWPMSDSNMLQSSLNSLQWCVWNVSIRLFLGEFRVFLWILLMERFLMSILYLTIIRYEHRSAEPQPVPFSLFVSLWILLVDRFLMSFYIWKVWLRSWATAWWYSSGWYFRCATCPPLPDLVMKKVCLVSSFAFTNYLSNFVVKTWRPFDVWRRATSSTKRQDKRRSGIILISFLLTLAGRWHLPFLA